MSEKIFSLLGERKLLLNGFEQISLANFTRSRTLKAYLGVDMKQFYTLVFLREAKSRLLAKEASVLNEICAQIELAREHAIKKRVLFFDSQICSKARTKLEDGGWKCYGFM